LKYKNYISGWANSYRHQLCHTLERSVILFCIFA